MTFSKNSVRSFAPFAVKKLPQRRKERKGKPTIFIKINYFIVFLPYEKLQH
jgi:hypothetical protein